MGLFIRWDRPFRAVFPILLSAKKQTKTSCPFTMVARVGALVYLFTGEPCGLWRLVRKCWSAILSLVRNLPSNVFYLCICAL